MMKVFNCHVGSGRNDWVGQLQSVFLKHPENIGDRYDVETFGRWLPPIMDAGSAIAVSREAREIIQASPIILRGFQQCNVLRVYDLDWEDWDRTKERPPVDWWERGEHRWAQHLDLLDIPRDDFPAVWELQAELLESRFEAVDPKRPFDRERMVVSEAAFASFSSWGVYVQHWHQRHKPCAGEHAADFLRKHFSEWMNVYGETEVVVGDVGKELGDWKERDRPSEERR